MDGDSKRIVPVQALRLLAAFAVLVGHAEIAAYHLGRYLGHDLVRPGWLDRSAFGVDLFFAISGFVMIHAARRGLPSGANLALARRQFAMRRIIRIVPLYWLMLGFVVAWGWRFGPARDVADVVHGFAFLPYASAMAQGRIVPPLDVGWTLNYEMLFYAVFALCLAARPQITVARVATVLAVAVACGMALTLPQPLAYWTDPIVLEFTGGMGIALLHGCGVRLSAPLRLALLALAVALVLPDWAGPGAGNAGWNRTVTWGVAGWLVLSAAVLGPCRLPAAPLWNWGGDVSYALYLVHMPLLMVAQFVWRHFRLPYGPAQAWAFALGMILASLLAAAVLHALFERPVTRWFNARLATRRVAAVA